MDLEYCILLSIMKVDLIQLVRKCNFIFVNSIILPKHLYVSSMNILAFIEQLIFAKYFSYFNYLLHNKCIKLLFQYNHKVTLRINILIVFYSANVMVITFQKLKVESSIILAIIQSLYFNACTLKCVCVCRYEYLSVFLSFYISIYLDCILHIEILVLESRKH